MPNTTTHYALRYPLSTEVADGPTQIGNLAGDVDSQLYSHESAASGVHGVTGAVVGTTDAQTLTNKTLTAPQADAYKATGLTGATAGGRLVGGTTGGAPVTGTFGVNDFFPDGTGGMWVCTAAGSPGTWKQVGTANAVVFANSGDSGKKLQMGSVSVTVPSGARNGSASVSFPTAFGATPKIVVSGDFSGAGGPVAGELPAMASASLIGSSSFTVSVYLFTTAAADRTITAHYIAIGS